MTRDRLTSALDSESWSVRMRAREAESCRMYVYMHACACTVVGVFASTKTHGMQAHTHARVSMHNASIDLQKYR